MTHTKATHGMADSSAWSSSAPNPVKPALSPVMLTNGVPKSPRIYDSKRLSLDDKSLTLNRKQDKIRFNQHRNQFHLTYLARPNTRNYNSFQCFYPRKPFGVCTWMARPNGNIGEAYPPNIRTLLQMHRSKIKSAMIEADRKGITPPMNSSDNRRATSKATDNTELSNYNYHESKIKFSRALILKKLQDIERQLSMAYGDRRPAKISPANVVHRVVAPSSEKSSQDGEVSKRMVANIVQPVKSKNRFSCSKCSETTNNRTQRNGQDLKELTEPIESKNDISEKIESVEKNTDHLIEENQMKSKAIPEKKRSILKKKASEAAGSDFRPSENFTVSITSSDLKPTFSMVHAHNVYSANSCFRRDKSPTRRNVRFSSSNHVIEYMP